MSPCQIKENKRKMSLEEKRPKLVISLSDLPVEILEHILSFLQTRDAVRTSMLSKQWEYLWKHTPNLDFDETFFPNRSQFLIIVGRAIFLRKSIKSFHLKCCVRDDASLITSWITAVVMRNVQELSLADLNRMSYKAFVLPNCLFSSKSLVKLKLDRFCLLKFNLPTSPICFPSLKTLTLKNVGFPDDHSTHQLFSTCSVLEELTLIHCRWYNLEDKVIRVCAPKLLRFTIYEGTGFANKFMVLGANLKHYDYYGGFLLEHCVSSSTSLDSARIVASFSYNSRKGYRRIYGLLGCLSNAKDLSLLDYTLEGLKGEELWCSMPMFRNLTRLRIDITNSRSNFNKLLQMLQFCPFLEVLMLNEHKYSQDTDFDDMGTIPLCLKLPSYLKIIEIHEVGGGNWLLNASKVFLKYALALKKIIISPSLSLKMNMEKLEKVLEQLLKFPKGSKCCEVVVRFVR